MLPRFPLSKFTDTPIRAVLQAGHRLCLDGGMGTYLFYTLKLPRHQKLWMLPMITEQKWHEDVIKAHQHFIQAGADVIEAFNYACTPIYLEMKGLQSRMTELNYIATQLARKAIDTYSFKKRGEQPRKVWLAGPLPPLGESYFPGDKYSETEFQTLYKQIIQGVKENSDFLLAQTLASARQGLLISKAAALNAPDKDLFVSFTIDDEIKIRNGDSIEDAVRQIQQEEIKTVIGYGINCSFPKDIQKGLEKLSNSTDKFLVAYPNDYKTFKKDWVVTESKGVHIPHMDTPAEQFREYARILLRNNRLRILGGCCATVPAHIAQIKKLIQNDNA